MLAAVIMHASVTQGLYPGNDIVKQCFEVADAMLKAAAEGAPMETTKADTMSCDIPF